MDTTAILIKDGARSYDQYGNETVEQERREIFARIETVYQNEFYNAAQAGFRPSFRLWIAHSVDYEDELEVEVEGKRYSVIRADWQGDGVALVCEEKINEDE